MLKEIKEIKMKYLYFGLNKEKTNLSNCNTNNEDDNIL